MEPQSFISSYTDILSIGEEQKIVNSDPADFRH